MTTIKEKAREYDDLNPCALPRVAYESGRQECARSVLAPLSDEEVRQIREGVRDTYGPSAVPLTHVVRTVVNEFLKLRGDHG